MERRQHPRVQLPLLVELQHPSINRQNCVARDISEGGVFVQIETTRIDVGAIVKLTLQNSNTIDTHPTPTVQMEVMRVEPEGLGLKFVNKTNRYLWESVERLRDELAIGRDYFQLHVSALVVRSDGSLLIVQQNGKWTFPGSYLIVGDRWQQALGRMLQDRFALEVDGGAFSVLAFETESSEKIPEAAVAKLFGIATSTAQGFKFEPGERYRSSRWVGKPRILEEITFADELTRSQALAALEWFKRRNA